ncbi:MAG: hypothetical protein CVU00_06275 [Bacteroidetes bacterium HGW-Bacteroidetes-17]|jgi:hypothetical protein|nr:MAG: hypothetical protein CVU00_06275 [Bacteroidetes bacterium HGW-Bacteroidetes-17]
MRKLLFLALMGFLNPLQSQKTQKFSVLKGDSLGSSYVMDNNKNFFHITRTKQNYSDVYAHWVRIDAAIDSLKHTNLNPYIKSLIWPQAAVTGQPFSFTVPDNIFYDEDNKVSLTNPTQLINGNPIPEWIDFYPTTKLFLGRYLETSELTVIVVVTDSYLSMANCPAK